MSSSSAVGDAVSRSTHDSPIPRLGATICPCTCRGARVGTDSAARTTVKCNWPCVFSRQRNTACSCMELARSCSS